MAIAAIMIKALDVVACFVPEDFSSKLDYVETVCLISSSESVRVTGCRGDIRLSGQSGDSSEGRGAVPESETTLG